MKLTELSDPDTVHKNILRLAAARAASDFELGVWLAAAHRLELWKALGLASFVEYADRHVGIRRRPAQERLRVALALESLPLMAEALREGRIHYSTARELTRIATEETEDAWLRATAGTGSREIEKLVSCHQPGDTPETPPTPPSSARLTFEVSVSTKALVAEARQRMIEARGASVSDDDLLMALATAALGSPARDEGLSSYQIAITVCDVCKTVRQRAGGEDVVVDSTVLEQARCDATELGRVDVADPARAKQTVPAKIRRTVMARQGNQCAVPACPNSAFRHLHHTVRRADGGSHDPELMCGLCTQHHQATHVGTLVIRGTYTSGFVFEHADGEPYGSRNASPKRAQVLATVLQLLVGMGHKQREAQAKIDQVAPHVGHDAEVMEVLRAAMQAAPLPARLRRPRGARGLPTHRGVATSKHRYGVRIAVGVDPRLAVADASLNACPIRRALGLHRGRPGAETTGGSRGRRRAPAREAPAGPGAPRAHRRGTGRARAVTS